MPLDGLKVRHSLATGWQAKVKRFILYLVLQIAQEPLLRTRQFSSALPITGTTVDEVGALLATFVKEGVVGIEISVGVGAAG